MTTVLHVFEPSIGGVPRYALRLSEVLEREQGVKSLTAGSVRADFNLDLKRSPKSLIANRAALARIVDAVEPDVVHLHSFFAGMAVGRGLSSSVPIVFQPHGWAHHMATSSAQAAVIKGVERYCSRSHDAVACLSRSEKTEAQTLGYSKTYLLGSAVDTAHFRPPSKAERRVARTEIGVNQSERLALFVGRSGRQKGADLLPQIFSRLAGHVKIVLAGDGLTAISREIPNSLLIGRTLDVRGLYWAADLVVQPSRWEGLSLVALEAAACGLSVVGFDCPGARDATIGVNGSLVPVGDTSGLMEAIKDRICDSDLRRSEGSQGRSFVVLQHGLESLGKLSAEMYHELANSEAG